MSNRGLSRTIEYRTYEGAKQRCVNPNAPSFENYGGRGIEFRFTSFEQFFSELGNRPSPQHSVDRINNDGHYEPGNVRWATRAEQMANSRRWKGRMPERTAAEPLAHAREME